MKGNPGAKAETPVDEARALSENGQFREAIALIDRALARDGRNRQALEIKAQALLALHDFDGAVRCQDAIIALDPTDPSTHAVKADLLVKVDRYEDAVLSYDTALAMRPKDTAVHRKRALALWLNGKTEEALAEYDRTLEAAPNEMETWASKADLLIALDRAGEAMQCLERAAQVGGKAFRPEDWAQRGYTLAQAGLNEQALVCFDRAIEKGPAYVPALSGRAEVFRRLGRFEEALACFDEVLELDPHSAETWKAKGNTLLESSRIDDALACFDKSLAIDPDDWSAWARKGYCLKALMRYAEAVAAYGRSTELSPDYHFAWEEMGFCYDELGDYHSALRAYRRAITLEPDSPSAQNNLAFVLFKRLKRYAEALPYLERATEIDSGEFVLWTNRAECLVGLERIDDARQCLEVGLQKVRNRGPVFRSLGWLYSEYLDNPAYTLEQFENAERADPVAEEASLLSSAELLLRIGRREEARQRASSLRQQTQDPRNRCVASYLVMASYALDGNAAGTRDSFEPFVEALDIATRPDESVQWGYAGFARDIIKSEIDLATKFFLLVTIDLQMRTLASPSLMGLDPRLPLTERRPEDMQPLAQSVSVERVWDVMGSVVSWFRDRWPDLHPTATHQPVNRRSPRTKPKQGFKQATRTKNRR